MSSGQRAIPFIQCDDRGKFRVTEEAVRFLSGIRGRIAVVCVAGPYRTGKSYLLNQFVSPGRGPSHGFRVASTVDACTKGIWIWGQPVVGSRVSTLFLDSEGLGSLEQNQGFDAAVLSLSVLLSSLFVLNTQGAITESALEQLELVAECSRKIRVRDGNRGEAKAASASGRNGAPGARPELSRHFPDFVWVLRDFALSLQRADGSSMSPNEYLEKALREQPGRSARAQRKNEMRRALRGLFSRRDCFALVRPANDERALQNLARVSWGQLRPEFQRGITALRGHVIQNAPVKSIEGAPVNGRGLAQLAQRYVSAINGGGFPTIMTAWESVLEAQAREAVDKAVEEYKIAMRLPADACGTEAELLRKHIQMERKLVAFKRVDFVGDTAARARLEEQLIGRLDGILRATLDQNRLRCEVSGRKRLEALSKGDIRNFKHMQFVNTWSGDRNRIIRAFRETEKGPQSERILQTFLENKAVETVRSLWGELLRVNRSVSDLRREKEVLATKYQNVCKEGKATADRLKEAAARRLQDTNSLLREKEALAADLRSARREHEKEARQMRETLAQRMRDTMAQGETMAQRLRDMKDDMKKEFESVEQRRSDEIQRRVDRVARKCKQFMSDSGASKQSQADSISVFEDIIENMNQQLVFTQAQLTSARKQLENAADEQALPRSRGDMPVGSARSRQRPRLAGADSSDLFSKVRFVGAGSDPNVDGIDAKYPSDAVSGPSTKRSRGRSRTADSATRKPASATRKPASATRKPAQPLEKMTVQQLKQQLTSMGVELPPQRKKKKFYVDLLRESASSRERISKVDGADDGDIDDADIEPDVGWGRAALDDDDDDDGDPMDDDGLAGWGRFGDADSGASPRAATASMRSGVPASSPYRPESLSVQQLKSKLTGLDVDLPPTKKKKAFYVDLLYRSDPALAGVVRTAKSGAQRPRKRRRT